LKPAKKPLMLSLSLGSYGSRQGTHHLDHGEDCAWFTPQD
jgi:hypothetical protein